MLTPQKQVARWKKSKFSISKCMNLVAKDFQMLVRLRDADDEGNCKCISCGVTKHYTDCDAGHYISRRFPATMLDFANCHSQCVKCNIRGGNIAGYNLALKMRYGVDHVYDLSRKAKRKNPWTLESLAKFRYEVKKEILEQRKRLGLG